MLDFFSSTEIDCAYLQYDFGRCMATYFPKWQGFFEKAKLSSRDYDLITAAEACREAISRVKNLRECHFVEEGQTLYRYNTDSFDSFQVGNAMSIIKW